MDNFLKEKVVPEVVTAAPKAILQIKWDGKGLEPGAEWTPTNVQNQPHVEWPAKEGALYTLAMADPDAPGADPSTGGNLHWLVVNIPGCDIGKGEFTADYLGAGAPKDTGLHRYCFFVFKQPGPIQPGLPEGGKYSMGRRHHFKLQDFVDKHNLGTAVAGNFFLAQYDDYVPSLHALLKD